MSTATETQDHHSKVVAAPNLDSLEDLGSHETVIHHPEQAEGVQSPITRIVFIAVDQSFHSGFAFDWAVNNLLRPENDLVILANVRGVASVPGPYGTSYMDFSDFITNLEEQHRLNSHTLLQNYATKLKEKNIACKAIAMRGDARDEIVRKVQELNADVLIMGSRGLGALKRTILGSVSDYCAHNCAVPIIIVKVPAEFDSQR